jgi:hypothetical protein
LTFDGRLTVVLAERTSQSAVSPHLDDRLAIGRHATGGLEVHRVPSSHLAMLEPPDVDVLATILRDCIARAAAKASASASGTPASKGRSAPASSRDDERETCQSAE